MDLALGQGDWTSAFFVGFGLTSVLFAAFVLLNQQNYKRLLAYSSVEHMGLIAFGVGMGPVGAAGAVMHMVGHTLAKSSLFFTAGEVLAPPAHDEDRQHPRAVAHVAAHVARVPAGVPRPVRRARRRSIFASELTILMAAARRSPAPPSRSSWRW